jgi:ArsR family transcriptional regulator
MPSPASRTVPEICDDAPKVICFNEEKIQQLRDGVPDAEHLNREADRLKALAHAGRLAVLHVLADAECCVCDLAHTLQAPVSTTSQHLRRLHRAGLVSSRQEGKLVFYALTDDCRDMLDTFLHGRQEG